MLFFTRNLQFAKHLLPIISNSDSISAHPQVPAGTNEDFWSTHCSCAQQLAKNFILRKSVKVSEEVFFWGCSLQPSGAILHNLVSWSKKKNSFPEMKVEREKQSGEHHPFRPTALSSAQKGQTGDL